MQSQRPESWSRREFLHGLTLVGPVGLVGLRSEQVRAEPPPETRTLRIGYIPALCTAARYVAEELLQAGGFTDVRYVRKAGGTELTHALGSGEVDVAVRVAWPLILRLDTGDPIVMLAGVHVGCYELLAGPRVHTVRDLKGRAVAVPAMADGRHVFLSILVAYVGLDPRTDIRWVTHPPAESMRLHEIGMIKSTP